MSPAPDDRQLALQAELLEALDGAPYVRWDLDTGSLEAVATSPGRAAALRSVHPWRSLRWLTALAADPHDPEHVAEAVRLLVRLAEVDAGDGLPVGGVTVPRGGMPLLPDRLLPPVHHDWDGWWTTTAPPPQSTAYGAEARIVDVPGDDPRLDALLAVASPDAPYPPGDPRVVRWAVIPDPEGGLPDTGGLAAVLAVTRQRSGAAHLNDVATHPERRGRRLARLLCGQVTADALAAGAPAVTLDMYADNVTARRVYESLGFVWGRGNSSGAFAAS